MNNVISTGGDIYFSDIVFNPKFRTLQQQEKIIRLRKKESEVLRLLCTNYPRPVMQQDFLSEVWRGGYVTAKSIAQIIRSLRLKIGDEAKKVIATVPKLGYQFAAVPVFNVENTASSQNEDQAFSDRLLLRGGIDYSISRVSISAISVMLNGKEIIYHDCKVCPENKKSDSLSIRLTVV